MWIPTIPELGRWRQEDQRLKVILKLHSKFKAKVGLLHHFYLQYLWNNRFQFLLMVTVNSTLCNKVIHPLCFCVLFLSFSIMLSEWLIFKVHRYRGTWKENSYILQLIVTRFTNKKSTDTNPSMQQRIKEHQNFPQGVIFWIKKKMMKIKSLRCILPVMSFLRSNVCHFPETNQH